jgi:hypothetical protein
MASSSSEPSDVAQSYSNKASSTAKKNDISIEHAVLEAGNRTDADVEKGGREDKESVVPRADGGKEAWLFLAGCFVFEALVWGKSISPPSPSPQH